MITRTSFTVFNDPTLPGRLEKIKTNVDPDFEALGDHLINLLYPELHQRLDLHLAKHLRRKVNPPVDTWFALSNSKRGYKMLPHFEVGIWPDTLFITLDLLAEMQDRPQIAALLNEVDWQIIPAFQISNNHASSESQEYSEAAWHNAVKQYQTNPKADFILGTWIKKDDPRFDDPKMIEQTIYNQIVDLAPLYQFLNEHEA